MKYPKVKRVSMLKAECSRDYKILKMKKLYPPYWDDGIYLKHGHMSFKYRSYKTWKHNRMTQYKLKRDTTN